MNRFQSAEEERIEVLQIDESAAGRQREKLSALRGGRDATRVRKCLEALQTAAREDRNTMPLLIEAVKAYVTVGEICEAFRGVYGGWTETSVI